MTSPQTLPPGSTIGILGGGQLGRMTALAAARLGYRCVVYAPEEHSIAGDVAAGHVSGAYDDKAALARFANQVDVITYEFENVPEAAVTQCQKHKPVRPGVKPIHVAQHRLREKEFFKALGIGTADYQPIRSEAEIAAASAFPGALVDFLCEISVIVARGLDGTTRYFPIGLNDHRDGILRTTTVPSGLPAGTLAAAERFGTDLADGLELVGLVALEMFVTRDGRVLANEMAPRPHNSGHWTIDACATSQFEQLVRAICGLPLGPVDVLAPSRMLNLIGEEANDWPRYLADPAARLHLYGKATPRPGRKMGHVTFIKSPS